MFLHAAITYSILFFVKAEKLSPSTNQQLNLNEIICNKLEAAKPYLTEGIPKLCIPSFKHIVIPYSVVEKSNVVFRLWNYNVTGLENFNVQKVDVDLKNNLFKLQLEFPYAEGTGKYGFKGSLLNIKIDGTGPIHCQATNFILNFVLKTELVRRRGQVYLRQVYRKVKVTTDSFFYMHMHDLYLGNPLITEIMNGILNDNSYYMFDLIIPIFEEYLDGIFEKAIDKILKNYTYDELLL